MLRLGYLMLAGVGAFVAHPSLVKVRSSTMMQSAVEEDKPRSAPRILELKNAMQLKKHARPERAPPQQQQQQQQRRNDRPSPASGGGGGGAAAAAGRPASAPPRKFSTPDKEKTKKVYDAPRRRVRQPQQFRGARGSLKKRRNKEREEKEKEDEVPVFIPDASIAVSALAEKLEKSGTEVVKVLMLKMGVLASVTQSVDATTARAVVEEFGRTWTSTENAGETDEEDDDEEGDQGDDETSALSVGAVMEVDDPSQLVPRAPVVTIMGHVDHGKTSLLDAIRDSRVAAGEAGGITQGIGAYSVDLSDSRSITFIDTPGHAAFSDMRARGANVTDIVVLVVAADDGVKEQTVDSIACARRAGVPLVVAVNKMDVEGADVSKVESELMAYDLVPEEFGGDSLFSRVSAKTKDNLDELLEKIWLQAELLELTANPNADASGVVVEAAVEKGLGVVATTLVGRGTLRVGDCFAAGSAYGKVRALFDHRGDPVEEAGPSAAVRVAGWQSGADRAPSAGDSFLVVADEQTARKLADARNSIASTKRAVKLRDATAEQFTRFVTSVSGEAPKEERKFEVVVKADCAGSVEALEAALAALDVEDDVSRVQAEVVYSGVGDLTKSDVAVASVSSAFVVAFNVGANAAAVEEEKRLGQDIRYYNVVYDVLDDVEKRMYNILSPTPEGEKVGEATVKQIFDIGKLGKVAGCGVTSGYIKKNANVRVMDGDTIKHEGKLRTLRNVRTDVDRVDSGSDCGLSFVDWEEFAVGDVVECYDPKA